MSQAEKIGQLIIGGYETVDDGCSAIGDLHLGGVILFRRNIRTEIQTRDDIAALQAAGAVSDSAISAGAVPLFIAVDQEGGRVSRLPASCGSFEAARAVGDREDPAYARSFGERTGRVLRRLGFNVNFAPVLDIDSNPQNTVIGDRAFGSTAGRVAVNGLAVMAGLASQGIIAGVKHFPGHGDTAVDSHDGLPTVSKSVADLLRFELVPFRAAIKQQAAMVMVAHIRLEQLDAHPASLSAAAVDGLLRTSLGFQGVVITDDLTMGAITDHYSLAEAAVLAIEAGCDILLICHGTDRQRTVHAALLEALRSGQLSETRIDRSLFRILLLKSRLTAD